MRLIKYVKVKMNGGKECGGGGKAVHKTRSEPAKLLPLARTSGVVGASAGRQRLHAHAPAVGRVQS